MATKSTKTAAGGDRFVAVMTAAERSGLLGKKSARIAGRISPELLERAKRRTGIAADRDLIEFALASIALEDDFGEMLLRRKGSVDPTLKLGF
jgi:hypothetical protein